MSVSLVRKVRLKVGAGSAKPGPAIGQALGPLGLNMAEFCKQFNEKTKNYDKDIPLPVELSAFSNRTFSFVVKTPPTSWFLLKCAGVERGSKRPGHDIVGSVHIKQIYEIALAKQQDPHLAALSHEALCRCVAGSANSIGLQVVSDTVKFTPSSSSSSSSAALPPAPGTKAAADKAKALAAAKAKEGDKAKVADKAKPPADKDKKK